MSQDHDLRRLEHYEKVRDKMVRERRGDGPDEVSLIEYYDKMIRDLKRSMNEKD